MPLIEHTSFRNCTKSRFLVPPQQVCQRENSDPRDELYALRWCLKFLVVDLRGFWWASCLTWILFGMVTIIIPITTSLLKYRVSLLTVEDVTIQVSLTAAGIQAFWSIRSMLSRHSLSRSMFLDELRNESMKVQFQLVKHLQAKFRLFYILITACAILNFAYKVYWFYNILPLAERYTTPYWLDSRLSWIIMCGCDFLSFVYRNAVLFVSSLLLQIHCILQVLRMEDFKEAFSDEVQLVTVIDRHKSVETHLHAISAEHELFVASLLVIVTATQLWCLVIVARPGNKISLPMSSELILSTACLSSSLIMCLMSAVRITHEAQSIKRHAVSWHTHISMKSTKDSDSLKTQSDLKGEGQSDSKGEGQSDSKGEGQSDSKGEGQSDSKGKDVIVYDDELQSLGSKLDTTNQLLAETMAYERRIALLTYLEDYKGGISLYGFVLDRQWLHALSMMQFSLVTWVLGQIANFEHTN